MLILSNVLKWIVHIYGNRPGVDDNNDDLAVTSSHMATPQRPALTTSISAELQYSNLSYSLTLSQKSCPLELALSLPDSRSSDIWHHQCVTRNLSTLPGFQVSIVCNMKYYRLNLQHCQTIPILTLYHVTLCPIWMVRPWLKYRIWSTW